MKRIARKVKVGHTHLQLFNLESCSKLCIHGFALIFFYIYIIYRMRHIFEDHMFPTPRIGTSVFRSWNREENERLLILTNNSPDRVLIDPKSTNIFLKKSFRQVVGFDWINGIGWSWVVPCHWVTLIRDGSTGKLITGFPTVDWPRSIQIVVGRTLAFVLFTVSLIWLLALKEI